MLLPVLIYLLLFCYKPMYGLVIAFKDYKITRGIEGSNWSNPWYKWIFEFLYRSVLWTITEKYIFN